MLVHIRAKDHHLSTRFHQGFWTSVAEIMEGLWRRIILEGGQLEYGSENLNSGFDLMIKMPKITK